MIEDGLPSPPVVVLDHSPRQFDRLEAVALALFFRALIALRSLDRCERVLRLMPSTEEPAEQHVTLPAEPIFRGAGACLARCLARGQYLRRRGVHSTLAIGVTGMGEAFGAHAWLEPFDDSRGHAVVHRIEL